MASISVTESDFSVLAFAAQAAREAGYEADAKRLDTLARKVNAALTGDNPSLKAAGRVGLPRRAIRWQEMPSTLRP